MHFISLSKEHGENSGNMKDHTEPKSIQWVEVFQI
jgi:hypothetical protein